nr:sodium/proton-translocating pyrophosphatase [Melioribacteraceae bacterium]
MDWIVYTIPFMGLIALLYSYVKNAWINKQGVGNAHMEEISGYIREGAIAFLKTEYKTIAVFVVIVAVMLGISNHFNNESSSLIALSFFVGAVCSALAGYLGMIAATKANVRTTNAAIKGLGPALQIAFTGGSIMGMNVVGLGILGLSSLFIFFNNLGWDLARIINVISGFSLGASSIALFARVG